MLLIREFHSPKSVLDPWLAAVPVPQMLPPNQSREGVAAHELTGAPSRLSSLFGAPCFLVRRGRRAPSEPAALWNVARQTNEKRKRGTVAVWRSNTRSAADIAHCRKMIFIKPMWCEKTKTKKEIIISC